jgi:hypothetical protein
VEIEHRMSQLERQNKFLKLITCLILILAGIGFSMGAASFNQDRGELLNITKIPLVDDKGSEVAIIDSKGINYSSKGSQLIVDAVIGRRRVEANANPENDQRFAELGTTSDKKCYMELSNKGATYHSILSDSGILESNF